MRDIRVAIVGYGLAGSVFHAPLVQAQEGMRVTSVVTGNRERQRQARVSCPGVMVLDKADELWRRASDVDLVVVATPTESHVPLALEAVRRDVPVVVDKPFATDPSAAEELLSAAADRGVAVTVFHNRRWDSDHLTLRRLLDAGSLGDVVRYESRFERWQPAVRTDRWRDTVPPERGGGSLLDLGSHVVDQACQLFGAAEVVHADVRAVRGGVSDDTVFLVLRHENGVHAHLSVGAVFGAPGPRLRVLGTDAAFVADRIDRQEDQLRAGVRPVHAAYGAEIEERWGWLESGDRWEWVTPERGAWPEFYAGVARALRDREPMPVDPHDALETQRLLADARALARQETVAAR